MESKSKKKANKVWVEIEVNKYTDGIVVFRGLISVTDLKAWETGELVDCSIKLESTYWFAEDSICVLGKGDGNSRHYTGEIYIRVDTIMIMYILNDDSFPTSKATKINNIFPFPGRNN